MTFEYFDIPYRYNETAVKLLFQNPHKLFIYWDISDEDEEKFLTEYGQDAYYYSKLFLRIRNESNGNSFDINIDPFAKSWYVDVLEPNSKYSAEIFRVINNETKFIAKSNILSVPTDRPCLNQNSYFKFIDRNSNEIKYVENIKDAINTINNFKIYGDLIKLEFTEDELKSKNISYIFNNPGSLNNIGSGTRYKK